MTTSTLIPLFQTQCLLLELSRQFNPSKHVRHPPGTVINGIPVGGQFKSKKGGSSGGNAKIKNHFAKRVHSCDNCGYTTNRDVAAAQVVKERGLSTVGQTGKMLVEGNEIGVGVHTPSRLSL